MHEWSLASGVILTLKRIIEEKKAKGIREVKIVVGELSQIDKDILKDAVTTLAEEELGYKVNVLIEDEKARLKCNTCGYEFGFNEAFEQLKRIFCPDLKPGEECENPVHYVPELVSTYIRCPRCGSPDIEIIAGRGVWIKSVTLELEGGEK